MIQSRRYTIQHTNANNSDFYVLIDDGIRIWLVSGFLSNIQQVAIVRKI